MKNAVRIAANEGDEGLQYEVFFSLRGAKHMAYELRENAKYEFAPERHQPKNEISGIWNGVCTLVREDYVQYLNLEGDFGQPEWDVWGRFNVLEFSLPEWKLAIFNCFFPDVARRGSKKTRALAFTGARFDDIEAATDPETKEVAKEFTDRYFNTARDAYLPQDKAQLEADGYPDVVIREMGTTKKNDHYFRAQLHRQVLREARTYAKDGFHVLLIGSMHISPREWDNQAVQRRPQGFKPEKEHVENRLDFEHKFLSQGHQQYLRGFDAWTMVNSRKEPNIHYAIISHKLGESNGLLYAQVLDKVKNTEASYYDVNDVHVSKEVVFHKPSLAAAEPEIDFPQENNEDSEDEDNLNEVKDEVLEEDAEGEYYEEDLEGSEE